jgi:WD40 repeat protein
MSEAEVLTRSAPTNTHPPVWSAQYDAPVNHVIAVDGAMVFLCGDGSAHFVSETDLGETRRDLHHGAILAACAVADGLLTGGDDGQVLLTPGVGEPAVLACHPGKWVNDVAASPKGDVAWSIGKSCYRMTASGRLRLLECPATAAALAFDPRGNRLAIAMYGGVWLWLPKAKENMVRQLEWKGSHLSVLWSKDGGIIITSMQERELHGWRLSDGAAMRMAGYPAKIDSMSWNGRGTRLATGGAPVAVIWPFDNGGPWQRKPEEAGLLRAGIAKLAYHPSVDVLAAGCRRGDLKIIRTEDGSELELGANRQSAITSLAWSRSGHWLAAGTQSGRAEIYSFGKS